MMKADLKRASFRDVPFSIESHELESGRRVAIHEYPGASQCFTEDLGRQKRLFLVNGFVSGRFCRSERDRLLTACEAEGPGDLIHPHYGKRGVACTGFRVSESALERGIIYFTLSFVESEPELKVSLIPDFLKNNVAFQTIGSAMDSITSMASHAQDFAANIGGRVELLEHALGPVFAVHEASTSLQSAIIQIKMI